MSRRVSSVLNLIDLKKASSIAVKYPLKGIEVVGEASGILETSKGRDMICSLIQYIADFYYACHKHSQIGLIKLLFIEGQIQSVVIAGKVRDSMKNGRKIFKFLKYLEEIKKFKKIYDKSDKEFFLITIFSYTGLVFKIMSQFFDNILWGINIGVLSEVVTEKTPKNIKNIKDTFSLIKSILKLIITHVKYIDTDSKEQQIFEEILKVKNKKIETTDESYKLCLKYINQRQKKRDKRYKLFITIIRILMLTKRLKIHPLNKIMDGALYSFCGLFCTLAQFFDLFYSNSQNQEKLKIKKNKNIENSENNKEESVKTGKSSPSHFQKGKKINSEIDLFNMEQKQEFNTIYQGDFHESNIFQQQQYEQSQIQLQKQKIQQQQQIQQQQAFQQQQQKVQVPNNQNKKSMGTKTISMKDEIFSMADNYNQTIKQLNSNLRKIRINSKEY